MGDVYGNVNVNYSYCKSVAQLKSAADYILGRRKEQVEDGVVKTEPHLYKAFGCNRDNFANSLLMTRKIHYKMSVYDEFLEELEARKKYHGMKAYGRQSTRKRDREER